MDDPLPARTAINTKYEDEHHYALDQWTENPLRPIAAEVAEAIADYLNGIYIPAKQGIVSRIRASGVSRLAVLLLSILFLAKLLVAVARLAIRVVPTRCRLIGRSGILCTVVS